MFIYVGTGVVTGRNHPAQFKKVALPLVYSKNTYGRILILPEDSRPRWKKLQDDV